jgi:hypothetical protein
VNGQTYGVSVIEFFIIVFIENSIKIKLGHLFRDFTESKVIKN